MAASDPNAVTCAGCLFEMQLVVGPIPSMGLAFCSYGGSSNQEGNLSSHRAARAGRITPRVLRADDGRERDGHPPSAHEKCVGKQCAIRDGGSSTLSVLQGPPSGQSETSGHLPFPPCFRGLSVGNRHS